MYTFFILLLPVALGQYNAPAVKPDVRFDDKSDRFDVSPLMDMGGYEESQYRRRINAPTFSSYREANENINNMLRLIDQKIGIPKNQKESDAMAPKLAELMRSMARRAGSSEAIDQNEWAWHDDMRTMENQNNYEKHLDQFRFRENRRNLVDYLHGRKPELNSRRSSVDQDKEVLLHHAVPIVMNVQGFLQPPNLIE